MWSPFKAKAQLLSPSSLTKEENENKDNIMKIKEVYIKTNDKLKHLINTVLIHYPTLTGEERLQLEKQYESELISYNTLNTLTGNTSFKLIAFFEIIEICATVSGT